MDSTALETSVGVNHALAPSALVHSVSETHVLENYVLVLTALESTALE